MKRTIGGKQKSAVRDKRISEPALFVDMRDRVASTRLWAPDRFIIDEFKAPILEGETITGMMKLRGNHQLFLFEGEVAKINATTKRMAATYRLLDPAGLKVFTETYEARTSSDPKPLPALFISMCYKTINWSLTGMLIGGYGGTLDVGNAVTALVRLPGTTMTAMAVGHCARRVGSERDLGIRFHGCDNDLFALLEEAMRRVNDPVAG